jgi:hypothetical protein
LFNLSSSRYFPNKKTGNEIFCTNEEGPSFGTTELSAFTEPFNDDENCTSNTYEDGFGIPIENGKNMLTNKEDRWFTITELEVWGVREIDE